MRCRAGCLGPPPCPETEGQAGWAWGKAAARAGGSPWPCSCTSAWHQAVVVSLSLLIRSLPELSLHPGPGPWGPGTSLVCPAPCIVTHPEGHCSAGPGRLLVLLRCCRWLRFRLCCLVPPTSPGLWWGAPVDSALPSHTRPRTEGQPDRCGHCSHLLLLFSDIEKNLNTEGFHLPSRSSPNVSLRPVSHLNVPRFSLSGLRRVSFTYREKC